MALDPLHEPDGVPHDIVFRTALAACVLAFAGLVTLIAVGWAGAVVVGIIAIPVMTVSIDRKAEREREQQDGAVGE